MARKGKKSSGATLQTKKHLSSLLFFFSSVYSNFTIQYNIFEFNKLQWFILFVGGVSLWLIPFVIEKTANKMIITLILAILNMIMYLVYIIATSGLATGLYLFLSFSNALLIPLLAVQAVEDAIPPELELMQRKISQRNRIPVQRLFLAILIAAPVGILTGYFTNDNVMAIVLLFFNLLSFSWFAYEHDSDYRAFMRPDRKVESKEQNIDDYRLVSQSENELLAPISDSTERLESSESESVVALDWKIVCTKTTFYGLVSKLPRLFYYCYYWCLLTVVLIYMYQLSCQFRYNKEEIKPAYLRVYPLLFTVVSYPVIEWKILPDLKVHKTFHKLLLSTVCAVLSLIVATILESYRVTETYGTDYYSQNPFTDKRVSSCPADLDDYCNDVPYSSTYKACHYPPMMSEQLHVGWQSIQFLLLSFSISLTGSSFIDFCFYEFFPSLSFISITLSTGLIRFFMCVVILIQYYILDPSKLIDYLTFNLNEENIPILLIYASLFIGFFFLYLFIEYFPFQEYYDYFCGELFQIHKEETVQFLSSAPPPPFNPLAAAANLPQLEPVIPFHPLREYIPAFTHILTEKDEKYDVFLTHDWGTAATQFLNHRRVSAVNAKLSALGLKTWFDEERMEGWNVRDQMTRGISRAHCVIVFITERYASKINSANPADNCYYEFNFAVHRVSTHKMIPVVMEEAMKDTRQWQGRLAAELANHLYVNMSDVIPKIVPEDISNVKEVDDEALKPNAVNGIDEDDALEFDQKCTEIVELVGSVLVKPLKDLTTEQTVLFFKSVGCLGIEDVLKEKRIVLTGKHLNNVETLEDLLSLDLNLPRIMVRTILEEILHCKDCGVRMSKLLRNVSRCA